MKKILFLMLLSSQCSVINAQVWLKSFTAGGYDSNNKLLGGSEVLQLIGHKNMLFASVGYWEDGNNVWVRRMLWSRSPSPIRRPPSADFELSQCPDAMVRFNGGFMIPGATTPPAFVTGGSSSPPSPLSRPPARLDGGGAVTPGGPRLHRREHFSTKIRVG